MTKIYYTFLLITNLLLLPVCGYSDIGGRDTLNSKISVLEYPLIVDFFNNPAYVGASERHVINARFQK